MRDEKLIQAVAGCQEAEAVELVKAHLAKDTPVNELLDTLTEGLKALGDRFACGEAFIPELVYGGEIFNKIVGMITPKLAASGTSATARSKGKVVLATVKGDLHDIGKNLVATFLRVAGYTVVDLGHDVANERLIEAVRSEKPHVVGLSSLLTTTMVNMKTFIEMLKEHGLRDQVKVVVGGAPVTPAWSDEIGADGYGDDAVDGKHLIDRLLGN